MQIGFVTTNRHKFEEVQGILAPFGIEVEQLDMEYEENHDADMETMVADAAHKLSDELDRPIVLEDTGLFFEAYEGFPGALPKFVFNTLGFKGIFKLLEGEKRGAFFKTVVGWGEPGQEVRLFTAQMHGQITDKVLEPAADVMPYDHIFIPDNKQVSLAQISLEEKNSFSQRGLAFKKFAKSFTAT